MPGTWDIGANADGNCSIGGSEELDITAGNTFDVKCGDIAGSNIVVSPSGCTTTYYSSGPDKTNCPVNITLTASNAVYPTAHAMSISGYNDTGASIVSQSATAASTTTVTIPLPPGTGDQILVVRDSTTNAVLGAGLFRHGLVNGGGGCAPARQCP